MPEYSILTKPFPKVDNRVKSTGQAQYTADLSVTGQLYGKVLGSPYAHAKILSIDTSRAERLPGVRAVCTGNDLPTGLRFGFLPTTRDESHLNAEKVHFIGDAIAAVAAVDEDIAQEALSLIKVDYEVLPPILDPEQAMKPGAALVHDFRKDNIAWQAHYHWGDVEKGFQESDYVREDTFRTPRVIHGFLEPHACIGQYDPSGRITLWASKQAPHFVYRILALTFDLPQSKVRVIQPYIGAGFGAKNDAFPLDIASVLLSKKTGGRPVKIVYTQKEILTAMRRRTPMLLRMKTGYKKDGTLVAQHLTAIADGGAYCTIGPITTYLTGAFITLPYKLAHAKYDGYRIYTNKPPSNAQRSHGVAHTKFAGETQLDMIAEDLGMDPVEIRLKNAVGPNHETINKIKVRSCGLKECIQKVADAVQWKEKRKKMGVRGKVARGLGFAAAGYLSGMKMPFHMACAVMLRVDVDGTVNLLKGATDCGQGSDTVLSQIVAEELGIALEDVQTGWLDTAYTPIDPGTFSSRVTICAGAAAKAAAEDARKQLAEIAAEALKANPQDIVFRNRRVFFRGNPERGMDFHRLARMAQSSGRIIMGRGYGNLNCEQPDFEHGIGDCTPAYAFVAQAMEVEVDLETGQVKPIETTVASDCGVILNPLVVDGQGQGCVYLGLGQTMYEQFIIDNEGRTLNASFADYKMPRAQDMPKMDMLYVDTYEPNTIYGIKEGSEAPQVTTYPVVVNAIYNAIGVWIKDLPVTPEKVLRALREKQGK